MKNTLLGIKFSKHTLEELIADSIKALEGNRKIVFSCGNPHSLVIAGNDKEFKVALNDSTFVVADGSGIKLMSRITGILTGPRITGHDYFTALSDELNCRGAFRVFFLGSTSSVLKKIEKKMGEYYPNLFVCGVLSPPFTAWSSDLNEEMINIINQAKPDLLWVGMTAPKQEKWVHENKHKLNVAIIGSIGAVFDFLAATHPRAPKWMCTLGIEWLYRLVREPRRMWRRNIVSTPVFVAKVVKEHVLKV